jgi:hypothetical protein
VATSKPQDSALRKILNLCYLVGAALLVSVLGVGAFVVAEIRHVNLLWIFFALLSFGFFAMARQEYRKEFRSVRFVLFVCVWLVINLGVAVVVLGSFGWLYWIPALLLEQFLFYMTAYWLFDLQPPSRGRGGVEPDF